jgi:hypothetical protein
VFLTPLLKEMGGGYQKGTVSYMAYSATRLLSDGARIKSYSLHRRVKLHYKSTGFGGAE